MLDIEYRDPNKSRYMVYETNEEVVVKVWFSEEDRPEEVNFSFNGGKLDVQGEAVFEKSIWERTAKQREKRHYTAFTHSIAIETPVEMEKAIASLREDMWTLRIPKKPAD